MLRLPESTQVLTFSRCWAGELLRTRALLATKTMASNSRWKLNSRQLPSKLKKKSAKELNKSNAARKRKMLNAANRRKNSNASKKRRKRDSAKIKKNRCVCSRCSRSK